MSPSNHTTTTVSHLAGN